MAKITLDKAIAEVESLLLSAWLVSDSAPAIGSSDPKVHVECWGEGGCIGLRVAEVSLTWVPPKGQGLLAGATWMQAEPDGLLICALVERSVLNRTEGFAEDVAWQDQLLLENAFPPAPDSDEG